MAEYYRRGHADKGYIEGLKAEQAESISEEYMWGGLDVVVQKERKRRKSSSASGPPHQFRQNLCRGLLCTGFVFLHQCIQIALSYFDIEFF